MKRPHLRVTLRTMLALTAIIAVLLSFELRKWRARKALAQAVRDNNGLFQAQVVGPRWVRDWVDDEDYFCDVTDIDFGPGFAGSGIYQGKPLDDDQLQAALAPIRQGTELDFLGLGKTSITDRSLEIICALRPQKLTLNDTQVTDNGTHRIGEISSLVDLDISGTAISDEGLPRLASLQLLEGLDLAHTTVTGNGLRALVELPRLRLLKLDFTPVSDDCMLTLAKFVNMQVITIRSTNVTPHGVEQLRKSLPNCNIVADY